MGFGVKALGLSHSDREMESEVGGKEVLVRAGVCRANLAHVWADRLLLNVDPQEFTIYCSRRFLRCSASSI